VVCGYGEQPHDRAAATFGNDVAEPALERFGEGRELLGRVKDRLRNFQCAELEKPTERDLG
jgi:hypothetical protein